MVDVKDAVMAVWLCCPKCDWESRPVSSLTWDQRHERARQYYQHFEKAHRPPPIVMTRIIRGEVSENRPK